MSSAVVQPIAAVVPGPAAGKASAYRKPEHHAMLARPEVVEWLRCGDGRALPESCRAARDRLIRDAEAALHDGPWSVVDKADEPPTGDRHDYLSLSIYYNPDPTKPDGLPYVLRDGRVNPEVERYDAPRLVRLSLALHALSLGYHVTGREAFALRAVQLVRCWFLDPATRMNPSLRFAQFIPGGAAAKGPPTYPPRRVEGLPGREVWVSYGGLIEGYVLPGLLESIERLRPSPAWTADDEARLTAWFADFLDWVLTSPLSDDEKRARNNHGTWYCTQVVAYAMRVGRLDLARSVLTDDVPRRIAEQFSPDGSQPEELVRANPLGYVCFTLAAFINLAIYGERLGIDLWRLQVDGGRGLGRGLDWLVRHVAEHPGQLTTDLNPAPLPMVWAILSAAAARYGWHDRVRHLGLDGLLPPDHRYRLIYPFDVGHFASVEPQ